MMMTARKEQHSNNDQIMSERYETKAVCVRKRKNLYIVSALLACLLCDKVISNSPKIEVEIQNMFCLCSFDRSK